MEQPPHLLALRNRIYTEIPITRHLQFRILACDEDKLVLKAPLAANVNHKGTVFGGSITMLATIAGWAMTKHILTEASVHAQVVIQKSSIAFHQPVRQDFDVLCPAPSRETRARFFQMLSRYGKARLRLRCTIHDGTTEAVMFEAAYVALRL